MSTGVRIQFTTMNEVLLVLSLSDVIEFDFFNYLVGNMLSIRPGRKRLHEFAQNNEVRQWQDARLIHAFAISVGNSW